MPIPICSGLPCILKTSLDSKTLQLHIADFEPNVGRHAARNILERDQGSPVEMRCPGCHAPHSRTRSKILGMARADLNKGSQRSPFSQAGILEGPVNPRPSRVHRAAAAVRVSSGQFVNPDLAGVSHRKRS
jgi:hypothetical protein